MEQEYRQYSVSVGSPSSESTNHKSKIFRKKMLHFADVYYVVRSTMVGKLSMYRFS